MVSSENRKISGTKTSKKVRARIMIGPLNPERPDEMGVQILLLASTV
jgi:hypothetical protein